MRIAVVCKGSVTEGLGHLFRAFSFASAAERRHEVQLMALADANFAAVFEGLRAAPIMVADEQELAAIVATYAPDLTVLDLLDLTDETFAHLRAHSPVLASISPVFRHAAATDLFFTRGQPPAGLVGPRIFAGLDYAIINARCRPITDAQYDSAISSPALQIMISFGGADADNHSRTILELLRPIEQPLLLWLMLGDGYFHSHDELVATIRQTPNHEIIMARTNRSMWGVAANCALAILSGGLSTLEAIYAGLPVISLHRANDPAQLVTTAYDHLCLYGGSFHDGSYRSSLAIVEDLAGNRHKLLAMRDGQRGVLDGLGAERVVGAIEAWTLEARSTSRRA